MVIIKKHRSKVNEGSDTGEKYRPKGYDKDRSTTEKILFSASEYIIYETRFGGWFLIQIQKLLAIINEYSINKIPKTTYNMRRKAIKTLTNFIFKILNWMNYFIEKRRRETRRKR